jgi:hypothetical protein
MPLIILGENMSILLLAAPGADAGDHATKIRGMDSLVALACGAPGSPGGAVRERAG